MAGPGGIGGLGEQHVDHSLEVLPAQVPEPPHTEPVPCLAVQDAVLRPSLPEGLFELIPVGARV